MKEWFKKIADRVFIKLTSAKTAGFVVATSMLYFDKLTGEQWLIAFGVFCGVNVAQKFLPKKE